VQNKIDADRAKQQKNQMALFKYQPHWTGKQRGLLKRGLGSRQQKIKAHFSGKCLPLRQIRLIFEDKKIVIKPISQVQLQIPEDLSRK
jgi:hypothetical protein